MIVVSFMNRLYYTVSKNSVLFCDFVGLGSGFTLRMNNSHTFHLSTLYTSTKQERQGLQPGQRLQNNRMLAVEAVDVEAGQEASYQLLPAMQELCRTLDAFVFVVDAGETKEAGKFA